MTITIYMLDGLQFGIAVLFVLMVFIAIKWVIGIIF